MTPEQIKSAQERCEKATPGPWEAVHENQKCLISAGVHGGPSVCGIRLVSSTEATRQIRENANSDADFIAHARTDLPAALDALEAAQARIAELESENARLERELRISEAVKIDLHKTHQVIHRNLCEFTGRKQPISDNIEELFADSRENARLRAALEQMIAPFAGALKHGAIQTPERAWNCVWPGCAESGVTTSPNKRYCAEHLAQKRKKNDAKYRKKARKA